MISKYRVLLADWSSYNQSDSVLNAAAVTVLAESGILSHQSEISKQNYDLLNRMFPSSVNSTDKINGQYGWSVTCYDVTSELCTVISDVPVTCYDIRTMYSDI